MVADLDEHVQPPGGQTVPGFLGSVDEMGYSLVHGAWVDRLAETGELVPVSTNENIGEFTFISVWANRMTSCFVRSQGRLFRCGAPSALAAAAPAWAATDPVNPRTQAQITPPTTASTRTPCTGCGITARWSGWSAGASGCGRTERSILFWTCGLCRTLASTTWSPHPGSPRTSTRRTRFPSRCSTTSGGKGRTPGSNAGAESTRLAT